MVKLRFSHKKNRQVPFRLILHQCFQFACDFFAVPFNSTIYAVYDVPICIDDEGCWINQYIPFGRIAAIPIEKTREIDLYHVKKFATLIRRFGIVN